MSKLKIVLAAALSLAAAGSMAGGAFAQTPFQHFHARRAEVNHRLHTQNRRIRFEEHAGMISPAKAARLHHQDRVIRREERIDASFNHGRLTRGEQRTLNQQENHVAREIAR